MHVTVALDYLCCLSGCALMVWLCICAWRTQCGFDHALTGDCWCNPHRMLVARVLFCLACLSTPGPGDVIACMVLLTF